MFWRLKGFRARGSMGDDGSNAGSRAVAADLFTPAVLEDAGSRPCELRGVLLIDFGGGSSGSGAATPSRGRGSGESSAMTADMLVGRDITRQNRSLMPFPCTTEHSDAVQLFRLFRSAGGSFVKKVGGRASGRVEESSVDYRASTYTGRAKVLELAFAVLRNEGRTLAAKASQIERKRQKSERVHLGLHNGSPRTREGVGLCGKKGKGQVWSRQKRPLGGEEKSVEERGRGGIKERAPRHERDVGWEGLFFLCVPASFGVGVGVIGAGRALSGAVICAELRASTGAAAGDRPLDRLVPVLL